MSSPTDLYIGLMSGTSADAMDAALVEISNTTIRLMSTYSLPIESSTQSAIHQLALTGENEIDQLRRLDTGIAYISCAAVDKVCERAKVEKIAIRAIGSHGQTIRHYPPSVTEQGYSLQVGDPNIIAEMTGITTVADFRRRDIAAGGQGAPLAAGFHKTAFHSANSHRAIINIGGMANITYLPKRGEITGFDTGPGNALMDSWFREHHQSTFDRHGDWAAAGHVDQKLLGLLLKNTFFSLPIPKSTGRETFNLPWLREQLAMGAPTASAVDIQATLLALTVESIARSLEQLDPKNESEVYICGGGSHNRQLRQQLILRLQPRPVETTMVLGIDPDWVEAIAFAWLARQTLHRLTGNIPGVTGAHRQAVLGGIYWGSDNAESRK